MSGGSQEPGKLLKLFFQVYLAQKGCGEGPIQFVTKPDLVRH